MRSRPILSLLVCALTLLCPALCLAETAVHAAEHEPGASDGQHEHPGNGVPHHHHLPSGEPAPVAAHSCICNAGARTGASMQIPAPEANAAIFAQPDLVDCRTDRAGFAPVALGDPPDCTVPPCPPLLI